MRNASGDATSGSTTNITLRSSHPVSFKAALSSCAAKTNCGISESCSTSATSRSGNSRPNQQNKVKNGKKRSIHCSDTVKVVSRVLLANRFFKHFGHAKTIHKVAPTCTYLAPTCWLHFSSVNIIRICHTQRFEVRRM